MDVNQLVAARFFHKQGWCGSMCILWSGSRALGWRRWCI